MKTGNSQKSLILKNINDWNNITIYLSSIQLSPWESSPGFLKKKHIFDTGIHRDPE